jgi:hypothetical protein
MAQIVLNVEVEIEMRLDDDEDRVAGSVKVLCCERGAGGAWLEFSSGKGPFGACGLVERFARPELSTTSAREVPTVSNLKGFLENMDAHRAKPTATFSRATTRNLVVSSELAVRFLRQRGVEDSIIRDFLREVDAALLSSGATAL